MDNAVMIQETEIRVKEYQGKRVVTFKDIDMAHQRPEGTARKRFNDNRKHFISGVDFFKTKCSEVRPFFGQTTPNGFNPEANIILITESGYLMLVKSFTDDLAWKVQRELVDSYFRFRTTESIKEKNPADIAIQDCIEAAKIMASVPNSQRYVVNILRHCFPDIDAGMVSVCTDTTTVDMPEKENPVNVIECGGDYAFPFNHNMLNNYLVEHNISRNSLEHMLGCSDGLVTRWCNGFSRPTRNYRIKICEALKIGRAHV